MDPTNILLLIYTKYLGKGWDSSVGLTGYHWYFLGMAEITVSNYVQFWLPSWPRSKVIQIILDYPGVG